MRVLARVLSIIALSAFAAPALAAQCGGEYGDWLASFQREAAQQGISQRALASLAETTPDPTVLRLDRNQGHFRVSFEEFIAKRITAGRLTKGRQMMKTHSATLARLEQQFGVAPEVVVAIWGMETDYGVVQGKQSVVRSLATLAHDCRRTEMFQRELMAALQIIDRGDLSAQELKGAWAGEIGQTQFLASSYLKYAVDFDGNGKRDLIRSVPDVLGSTANYLKGYGWKRGPYAEGSANFRVLSEWNKSSNYQKAIALFAERLISGE